MLEDPPSPPLPPVPEARRAARRGFRLSLVWIVPIVAALAGAWVAVTRILAQGPEIVIVLDSAEGLEAGKTKIHYNGVAVGTLTGIRLSKDHRRVVTHAQMEPGTENFLVEGTEFWVVRPRISGANVTGLGTLISGAYIGMQIGDSTKSKRRFVALEDPPVVASNVPGRSFFLRTSNLGSLDHGTPIYFRRLKVGEVASYVLDPDGKAFAVRAFVQAPYDQYVNPNTRFWHASGIDVSLDASGLQVRTESLVSILIGGIAFETPAVDPVLPPAEPETRFTLFASREEAFKLPARDPQLFQLQFDESVRGLAAGAPVEFRGIPIGEVVQVTAQIDAQTFEFEIPVTIDLDAQRLGVHVLDVAPEADLAALRKKFMETLVSRGLRAQLRSGSLLTGSLFVALDFFPDAQAATIDWTEDPPRFPTVPGQLAALETSIVNLIKKLERLPLDEIGEEVRKAIADLDRTLVSARKTLDSADRTIAPDSALAAELGATLQELSRAARGVRVLADYLERHPEALLRGKPGGPE